MTASPTVKTLQSGKESEKGKKRENTVQLHNKLKIPKFYHPYGKPVINQNKEDFLQGALHEIGQLEDEKAFKQHMKTITKVSLI